MPAQGRSVEAEVIASLNGNPLGSLQGEANLQTPFNATSKHPNVFVINHSRTKTRKVCVVPVSEFSGGEDALQYSKEHKLTLHQHHSIDTLYAAAKKRDMSIYEDVVRPVVVKMTIDGRDYFISPAPENDPDNPPMEQVDEGVWDLYLGNYDRMHPETKPARDQATARKEMGEETARLALAWSGRKNPVWRVVVDGKVEERNNPFGYIEFVRQVPTEAPRSIDKSFVTAMDIAE